MPAPRWIRRSWPLVAVALSLSCADDPTGPGGGEPSGGSGAAKVVVSPSVSQLVVGQTTSLTAEVRDSADVVVVDPVVTWSSDKPGVATVDATGLVTAVAPGSATITASSGPAEGTAGVGVDIATICDCAVVIDSTNLRLLSRDSLTGRFEFELLDGEMPEIDTTSVVIGAQDEGFLRHVSGVERSGSRLTLVTSQAGLADVIENGAFGGSTQVFAEDGGQAVEAGSTGSSVIWGPTEVVHVADGVTQVRPGVLNLSGLKLSPTAEQADESSIPVDFEFAVEDGALRFGPSLDLGAKIGAGTLQSFRAIYTGGLALESFSADGTEPLTWSVSISKEIEFLEAKKNLVTLRKPFVYFVGYVPIAGVLLFTIDAKAAVSATGSIAYEGTFGAGYELRGGVRYDAGRWTPVFGTTADWDGAPPPLLDGLGAAVEAKATFTVQPELFLKFYYVAGPFVNVQPTLEAPAQLAFPGMDWFARADYVTRLGLGGRAEILRKQPKGKFKGWTGDDLLKLEFGATLPLHRPLILAEIYSRGPLVVTDSTAGDDLDDAYDVALSPGFRVNDALLGLRHAASTQSMTASPIGTRRVFEGIRSGEGYPHDVRLRDVAGNCTVQGLVTERRGVTSDLRIATPGITAHDTARVHFTVDCIPLGAVAVTTTTSGPDVDPDGYRLLLTRIDTVGTSRKWFDDSGGTPVVAPAAMSSAAMGTASFFAAAGSSATADGPPVDVTGTALVDSLIPLNPDPRSRATGRHAFALQGVRENCAVASPGSREAAILSGDTLSTHFDIRCIALGRVAVTTRTDDADPPPGVEPAAYTTRVLRTGTPEDSVRVSLGTNDQVTIDERIPLYTASGSTGEHQVELAAPGGLPARCSLAGSPIRNVTVLSGETAGVIFEVACTERLIVQTSTTGPGSDPDGFTVLVAEDGASGDTIRTGIGADATVAIAGTTPGPTSVTLSDVSPNCSAAVPVVGVDIGPDDVTLVTFDVTCPVDAVRDSVVYAFADIGIATDPERLEAELGRFAVPPHLAEFGVEVSVDVGRTTGQVDEAFAVGTGAASDPSFIGGACPVVPDDGGSGRKWVRVGVAPLAEGEQTFHARHGTQFSCYVPVGNPSAVNSVHFFGLKLVFWRSP